MESHDDTETETSASRAPSNSKMTRLQMTPEATPPPNAYISIPLARQQLLDAAVQEVYISLLFGNASLIVALLASLPNPVQTRRI